MVVVYGTVCLDRLRRVAELPGKGGYVEISAQTDALGGEAANTALALRTWGAEPVLYGNAIGQGVDAERTLALLAKAGLNDEFVPSGPFEAPYCDIYVTPEGERTMFGYGFEPMGERTDISNVPYVEGCWITVDMNHGAKSREVVVAAREHKMHAYALDLLEVEEPLGPGCVWQSSTDRSGMQGDAEFNLHWVEALADHYCCVAILTDGQNGLFVADRGFPPLHCPAYRLTDAIDSTGAGDVFRAGMLFGLDQGWELADCLRFASAAGALNSRSLGATTGIPSRAEVEALICAQPQVSARFDP